jgi:hypothetical protein
MAKRLSLIGLVIGVALLAVLLVGVVFADGSGFTFEFVAATYNGSTTTITYTVCSDGTQPKAMSHLEVETCVDYYVSQSGKGAGYSPEGRVVTYTLVETGTLQVDGVEYDSIKWGDAKNSAGGADPLGEDKAVECDIFTYQLRKDWTESLKAVPYEMKMGQQVVTGTITGPDCEKGPTAVTLATFTARSTQGKPSWYWPALAGLALLAAAITFRRRR